MLSIHQDSSDRSPGPKIVGAVLIVLLTLGLSARAQVEIPPGVVDAQAAPSSLLSRPTVDDMQQIADELDYIKLG